jgi:hypothetical protein
MPASRCVGVLTLLHAAVALAQSDPVVDARAQYTLAVRAYQARDYAGFLQHARAAQALRPTHGGVTYALASALALTTGDSVGALETLRHFAKLGYAADVATDSDFAALRYRPAFIQVAAQLAKNQDPVVRSRVAFTLPQPDLLTEGIAYDPTQRAFYIGSMRHRKILRVSSTGAVSDFVTAQRDSLWAPMGMKVDPGRRALRVAVAARPQMLGYSAADSRTPAIYWIPSGSDSLTKFLESPLLLSAQGLALTPDQRWLYVAEYARGILRADLRTRSIELLPAQIRWPHWVSMVCIYSRESSSPSKTECRRHASFG